MRHKLILGIVALLALGGVAIAVEHGGGHAMGDMHRRMAGGPGMHGGPGMRGGMEHHFAHVAEELELTETQRAAAKKLHEDARAKAEPLHEKARAAHEEVATLLDSANPDPTALGQKMLAAHAAGAELRTLHEEAMTQFKALLNADQLKKLEEMESEHTRWRCHGEACDD